eukprot:504706_1
MSMDFDSLLSVIFMVYCCAIATCFTAVYAYYYRKSNSFRSLQYLIFIDGTTTDEKMNYRKYCYLKSYWIIYFTYIFVSTCQAALWLMKVMYVHLPLEPILMCIIFVQITLQLPLTKSKLLIIKLICYMTFIVFMIFYEQWLLPAYIGIIAGLLLFLVSTFEYIDSGLIKIHALVTALLLITMYIMVFSHISHIALMYYFNMINQLLV